jgi:hypothetical protein
MSVVGISRKEAQAWLDAFEMTGLVDCLLHVAPSAEAASPIS